MRLKQEDRITGRRLNVMDKMMGWKIVSKRSAHVGDGDQNVQEPWELIRKVRASFASFPRLAWA
jgi:hypothetical protein